MGKPARTWRTSAFVYKWGFLLQSSQSAAKNWFKFKEQKQKLTENSEWVEIWIIISGSSNLNCFFFNLISDINNTLLLCVVSMHCPFFAYQSAPLSGTKQGRAEIGKTGAVVSLTTNRWHGITRKLTEGQLEWHSDTASQYQAVT